MKKIKAFFERELRRAKINLSRARTEDEKKNLEIKIEAYEWALKIGTTNINRLRFRAPTKKQVEKLWRAKWIKTGDFYSRCSKCGDIWNVVWTGAHTLNFCPNCGSPMTDKAVKMMIKRLEMLEGME